MALSEAPGDGSLPAVLQARLGGLPGAHPQTARLPGTRPIAPADWIVVDDAYAGQMALRERLIAERPTEVIAALPGSGPLVADLVDALGAHLSGRPDFRLGPGTVRCPDGRTVALPPDAAADPGRSLAALGRIVAEDLCLLDRPAGEAEHRLVAAVLCFPDHWTLTEKLGHPLLRIHRPVAAYDAEIARRVQRLFDGLKPGRPLMRYNLNPAASPAIFTPRREDAERPDLPPMPGFLRSERQVLTRLPRTGAVVFSIQTRMVRATGAG